MAKRQALSKPKAARQKPKWRELCMDARSDKRHAEWQLDIAMRSLKELLDVRSRDEDNFASERGIMQRRIDELEEQLAAREGGHDDAE